MSSAAGLTPEIGHGVVYRATGTRVQVHNTGPFSKKKLPSTILSGYLPLVVAVLIIALPLVWMLISSFKRLDEIIQSPVQWLPHTLYFGNYTTAASQVPFARDFLNSVIVSIIGASIKVLLAVCCAYGLVFCKVKFKRTAFVLVLIPLMVPAEIAILPNYMLIAGMGGLNTYWGIILPQIGSAFGTFLLRQHFLTFPTEIIEAAEIDGAGHWTRLWRVVAPISRPAITTVALISLVTDWNSYLWPLIITNDPNMMTLPVGLTLLQDVDQGGASWGLLMAGSALVIVPILVVFATLQRHIVTGLAQGAVKG